MSDMRAIADRVEIEALRGEHADAAQRDDCDHFASLFTHDAVWRMPDAGIEFVGREQIRAGRRRLAGSWEYFVQNTHPGVIRLDGDTASGRAYIREIGRRHDGRCAVTHGVFHDRYRRTPDGWKFTERVFELTYLDTTPLAGSSQVDRAGINSAAGHSASAHGT